MAGIGDLMEIISDISELFDEQNNIPLSANRHQTSVSRKRNSQVNIKKDNHKSDTLNYSKEKSDELNKNEESILGKPLDHSSHIRENFETDKVQDSTKKTQLSSMPYNLNHRNLRNAIVLSEILSPPLALRNRRFR